MRKRKVLILSGLLSGAVFALSWVTFHFLFVAGREEPEMGMGESLGYITMLIALSTVYFGVRNYRDKQLGGVISFKDALLNGLIVVLIASEIYVICWAIYYPIFIPDFMDMYTAEQIKTYQESGLSGEELQFKINQMKTFNEQYKNPLVMILVTFLEIFPVGLIVAVVSAFLLKKQD